MKHSFLSRIGIVAMLLAVLPAVHAATFCVNTTSELQDALEVAGSNGANDVIRIKTGTYTYTFPFVQTMFVYDTQEDFDITLQGGWAGSGDACARRFPSPASTVLDGGGEKAVLWMKGADDTGGDIIVEQLTVRGGAIQAEGGGMRLGGNFGSNGFNGSIVVERVYFDDNFALEGAGLFVRTNGGVRVRNSIFRSNSCETNACAASIAVFSLDSSDIRAVFSNNTIFGNVCSEDAEESCITGGVLVDGLGLMPRTSLLNNAFALNDGNDLELPGGSSVDVLYNNINVLSGTPTLSVGNLDIINPHFVSPILDDDFHLQSISPLRNAGYDGFLIGLPPYSATDYAGIPRVQENRIDIGAHEFSERIFEDGFD
jgi:hypothetical protein